MKEIEEPQTKMSTLDGKTREEKLYILDDILRRALRELCTHARDRDFLAHPYGRKPDPTPLITEEQFIQAGGLHCDDGEPDFKYDYGFDPLLFLGEYIKWAHPDSVGRRHDAKVAAQERLNKRANHAKTQLEVQKRLKQHVQKLRAGIQWGPLTLPLTSSSLRCFVKAFKHGVLYLQLSDREDFETVLKTYKVYMKKSSEEEEEQCPVRYVDFCDLEEKTQYFVRATATVTDDFPPIVVPKGSKAPADRAEVKETDADFADIQQLMLTSYLHACNTIPEESMNLLTSDNQKRDFHPDAKVLANLRFFGQLPVDSVLRMKSNDGEDESPPSAVVPPAYACLLGDLLQHSVNPPTAPYNTAFYTEQLQLLLGKLSQWKELKESSLLLAWRDSHVLSGQYLKQEEHAFKQYRHDLKKYNKKHGIDEKGKKSTARKSKDQLLPPPPTLKRPQPSPMLDALLQTLPVAPVLGDNDVSQSCRMLYRTTMVGSEVQLILLDMRRMQSKTSVGCDYLGKEQAEWLQYILENSTATWKIIGCGKSFGVCSVEERVKTAEPDFEEVEVEMPGAAEAKASEESNAGPEIDAAEGEEVARVSTATKMVQMVVSESELQRAKEKKLANLYDECEETFGRSKYSLQHILSKLHTKADEKEKTVEIDENADLEKQLFVRSGIVLMTGGVTSSWVKFHFEDDLPHDDFLTAASMVGKVEDKATPPFCAAYYHLSSPISQPVSLTRMPSSSAISTSSKQVPYCVELSLGNGRHVEDFHFLHGLDAKTHFLPSGLDSLLSENSHTECELSILDDGALKVQLFVRTLDSAQEKQIIFEKWLTIPTLRGDESDDQSGSVYVA